MGGTCFPAGWTQPAIRPLAAQGPRAPLLHCPPMLLLPTDLAARQRTSGDPFSTSSPVQILPLSTALCSYGSVLIFQLETLTLHLQGRGPL